MGRPFVLCLEASTIDIYSNRDLTFWSKGHTRFPLYDAETNCTSCSCLVSELVRVEREEERVKSFLTLYKTNPCLAKADKLLTVLYISNVWLSDRGNYSFQYTDSNGRTLPLMNERQKYTLSVGGK